MIRNFKYLMIIILAVISSSTEAQYTQALYYMNLPQNHLLNPASRPTNRAYLGLPVLSGINFSANNNFINFSDIFIKGQRDSLLSFFNSEENADKFLAKISDKNSIKPEATVPLFGLGFTAGRGIYIFLDINERVDGNISFPGSIFHLALKGNEQFVGSKINLASLNGYMKYYREVGLGFSKNYTNKLRIGVKGKLLFGIASASVDNRSLGISVNEEDYTHKLDADIIVNLSAPLIVYKNQDNTIDSIIFDESKFNTTTGKIRYFTNTKNIGLGIDLGATYDINDKFTVSAAITDVGFIKWKTDVNNLHIKSSFNFSGLNMVNVINGTMTFDSLANEMLDSLKNSFTADQNKNPFTNYLPSRIILSGSYNLTKIINIGLLSCTSVIDKQISEALTLSTNLNLNNSLSVSLAYTAANHRYDNLGAGLAFRTGFLQFYGVVDRIPFSWNRIIVSSNQTTGNKNSIVIPTNWNTINARIGINLVFGNKVKKKDDKPMVLVE
jgi:hypothetical protein